jgi:hypothetical protein
MVEEIYMRTCRTTQTQTQLHVLLRESFSDSWDFTLGHEIFSEPTTKFFPQFSVEERKLRLPIVTTTISQTLQQLQTQAPKQGKIHHNGEFGWEYTVIT